MVLGEDDPYVRWNSGNQVDIDSPKAYLGFPGMGIPQ
jgi:hypothetical protein